MEEEQYQVLEDLEKQIGKSIRYRYKISPNRVGVTVAGNNVIELSLRLCGLYSRISGDKLYTNIPESITNLKSLKKLNLNNNSLFTLPEMIIKLKSLKELDISNNDLTLLPESIGNLESLELLLVKGNKLTKLPESIGNLKNLRELDLYDNELTTLPDSIGNLKSLKKLDLGANKILRLPESFKKLKSLEALNLIGSLGHKGNRLYILYFLWLIVSVFLIIIENALDIIRPKFGILHVLFILLLMTPVIIIPLWSSRLYETYEKKTAKEMTK